MKKSTGYFFIVLFLSVLSCKKTPEYVQEPYLCNCGNLSWAGASYPMLGVHQASADTLRPDYRRYHFSSDVRIEGEEKTHSISGWFVVENIAGGGQFITDLGAQQFSCEIDEYNLNGVPDTLKRFIPISGSLNISKAQAPGLSEGVTFQLTLGQIVDSTLSTGSISCSGDFSLIYTAPIK